MSKRNIAGRRRARGFALQALYQWQFNPSSIEQILSQFLSQDEMVSVDQDFFKELVQTIIEKHQELDRAMQPFLSQSDSLVQPVELAILRIGSYELKYCLETPYRVIVNEAVELAKAFGAAESYRYVNGVLHGLAKACRTAETQ